MKKNMLIKMELTKEKKTEYNFVSVRNEGIEFVFVAANSTKENTPPPNESVQINNDEFIK